MIFSFTSCVEFPESDFESSQITLKSANGYSSESGEFYVQQGIATLLYLESKTYSISSAFWRLDGKTYDQLEIVHTFSGLGEFEVKVEIKLSDGNTLNKTFKVTSVLDISTNDPVKMFSNKLSNGKWEILVLLSKERLRFASSDSYYFLGTMNDWVAELIPASDLNFIINAQGLPEKTSDVGKYIGARFQLDKSDEHKIAIQVADGSWADFSGSVFIKKEKKDIAVFYFDAESGELIPQGDYSNQVLPGKSGDNYFRFEVLAGQEKIKLFFRLENDYTNKSFFRYRLESGLYSSYVGLNLVPNFPLWGSVEMSMTEFKGKILDLRYGADNSRSEVYSGNMSKSRFYSNYFKSLRLSLFGL